MTIRETLTVEQTQQVIAANQQQRASIVEAAQMNAISHEQYVYFALFDGTNNTLQNEGSPQPTNVAQLSIQAELAAIANVTPVYFEGPGTPGTLLASSWLSPQVTRQVIAQANRAYEDFRERASSWVKDGKSIAVAISAFSRGNASAAIFTQMLYERGLVDIGDPARVLIAPGHIKVAAGVLFDPVLTGVSGNMAFAPTVSNVVDIFARDEYRVLFRAADYRAQPGVTTISMFGSHSDIGGAYDNGIGGQSLHAATDFLLRSGLRIDQVLADRQFQQGGPYFMHSERDKWIVDARFDPQDMNLEGTRPYISYATPATATVLEGLEATKLELFDGRTITVTDITSSTEKVLVGMKPVAFIEQSELSTYRIQSSATKVVNKIRTTRNIRNDSQIIEAKVLDNNERLRLYVPAAQLTRLSVSGADGVVGKAALGDKLIVGDPSNGLEIAGGTFKRVGGKRIGSWVDSDAGIGYWLVGGTPADGNGELRISLPVGSGGRRGVVVIENFKDGMLGISLGDVQDIRATATSTNLEEGGATTVTLSASSASNQDRTFRIAVSGLQGFLAGVFGDDIRSFSGGDIEVTLMAGQRDLKFALLERGDIDSDQGIDLSATQLNTDGTAAGSDTVSLNIQASVEIESLPVTIRDILGDRVLALVPGTDDQYQVDDLGNFVVTSVVEPYVSDFRVDSLWNDNIRLGGSGTDRPGADYVRAHAGGDDLIWQEDAGRIWAHAGPGNDVLIGGTGRSPKSISLLPDTQDMLMGGAGDDRIFGQDMVTLDAAIEAGNTEAPNDVEGDFLSGGAGNDLLIAGNERDIIAGGGGTDVIVGGAGGDLIFGDADYEAADVLALGYPGWGDSGMSWTESGTAEHTVYTVINTHPGGNGDPADSASDTIHAGEGDDSVLAGAGDDTVYSDAGNDRVWGDAGDDLILGGLGDDVLVGDNGEEILAASLHGSDFLDGGEGNDRLLGSQGSDVLYGGAGDDVLIGDSSDTNAGDDYLDGEDGNDELIGAGGSDTLYGGDGNDRLGGDATNVASEFHGDDTIDGEAGDDEIAGGGGNDTIFGGEGNDTIEGDGLESSAEAQGADFIDAGDGDDMVLGGGGDDTIFGGAGADQLFGEAANDPEGTEGNDYIDGGEGNDLVVGAGGDDILFGGDGEDTLAGDSADTPMEEQGDDYLLGGEGADTLQGYGGNDVLDGGDGADTLVGMEGDDSIIGGAGDDIASGGEGDDHLDLGVGDDQATGNEGNDVLAGGVGRDQLFGEDGDDTLEGGDGDDILLSGGDGNDTLLGGAGSDFLQGDAGDDTLDGGEGADLYAYTIGDGIDHIQDSGSNTLFVHGVNPFFLELGLGSLVLSFGSPGNEIHLDNFDPNNIEAGAGIDTFVFDDGTVLTYQQLIEKYGFTIGGTPDADVLEGTNAADTIHAYESDDVVIGKAGDDTIDLGQGNDVADAGEGDDTFTAGDGEDVVLGGAGSDSILGEAGDDQLSGDEGADDLQGGEGADVLDGGEGDDRLYGGADADVLVGGIGDDTYVIDDASDSIVEFADEGDDVIEASITYTIVENVERLVLVGTDDLSGIGNANNNAIAGNAGDNLLYGLEGEDALSGNAGDDLLDGGAGADVMSGGLGDDTYLVDYEGDVVAEQFDVYDREVLYDDFGNVVSYGTLAESGGYDSVESSVSFALDQWTEALVLTGGDAIDGTGNVEANYLQGNDADNTLYAYRLNGESDTYPWLGTIVQQFTSPRNAREEMLHDKANAAIFRAEFPWFIPLQVDLGAGEGDELVGLGGNDRLYGGLDNDYLYGGDGDDLLYGFAGADTMEGGAGNDSYVVSGAYSLLASYLGGEYARYEDESEDTLIELADEGIDTVYSEVDFALPEHFENLTLLFDTRDFDPDAPVSIGRVGHLPASVGEGNDLDNVITANNSGNSLYGYGGDDTLIGGAGRDYLDGGEGIDWMAGGANDDEYNLDAPGDLVIELAGGGHDLVYAHVDYTLTDHVEDLYLGGDTYTENLSGTGNELDNYIEGNDGNNVLLGLGGNDVLNGWFGDDVMDGGAGDDTYYVDSELDVTAEAAGAGHDTVYSTVSHTLGDALEDLYLEGFDHIWGMGNAQANLIVGNDFDNDLLGLEGNDVLRGGAGWDSLQGDEGDDRLEGGSEGDYLEGGAGDDVLDGGYDDDTMVGGLGDDTYYVDSDFDVVSELDGEGIDTVYESVWYYTIGENVENALMLGDFQNVDEVPGYSIQGNALDNEITGNDNENWLYGNEGHDAIDGRARNDYLRGGLGDDSLYGGDDAIRHELRYMDAFRNIYSWDFGGLKLVGIGESELASNSDDLEGGQGNDTLDGGSGNDWLEGGQGNDYLYGGDDGLVADDAEYGGGGEEEGPGGVDYTEDGKVFLTNRDYLAGGDGDDVLDGGSDNDELYGGDGNDTLLGGADGPLNRSNNDYLDGGEGIDYMAGGTGDDTYVVNGFFVETTGIEVYDDCGELVPGAITRVWTTDTVLEHAGEGADTVYSAADFTLPEHVEELRLEWFTQARIGRGNAGDNYIVGNEVANRLEGGAGDDELHGETGDDVLDGGAGDDTLYGESGNDTFLFGAGYGHDTVVSTHGGLDRVHLAHGITPGDVTLIRQGNDVVISLGGGDTMRLAGWFSQPANRVRQVLFCDDPAWDEAAIAALIGGEVDPVSAQDDFAGVQEDALPQASGNVLDNDFAGGATLTVADPGIFAGTYGTLELLADGSFTYTLDNGNAEVQAIPQGESWQDYLWYEAVDGLGATAGAALIVDIAGTNDAPVLDPGAGGAVVEDAGILWRYADGQLLENGGFESGFTGWHWEGNEELYGLNSVPSEGSMAAYFGAVGTPTLLSQAVETVAGERYLLEFLLLGGTGAGAEVRVAWNGETLLTVGDTEQQFDYRPYQVVLDGIDGESLLQLALRNDAGYWHLDDVRLGLLQEFEDVHEFQETSGNLAFTDVDYSDWHVVAVQPQGGDYLGAFDATIAWDSTYGGEGQIEWSFSVANEDLQFLAEGETREQVYDLIVEDPFGARDTKSIAVTLRGVNDPLEIEDDWIALSEDDVLAVSGNVFDNDYELDLADALTVLEPGSFAGVYGTLELAADGSYTYILDNGSAAVQALNAEEFLEESLEFEVTDGHVSNLPMLWVEIEGANDAPLALDDAASVQEDGVQVAAGNVLANDVDVDAGSEIVVTNPGSYAGAWGSLTLGADGSYVYTLDNALAQPLTTGDEMEEVFAYEVTDGIEPASAELTVTVLGTNDEPTADDLAASVSEDGPGVTLTPVFADADGISSLAVGAFRNTGFEQGGFSGWQISDAALGDVLGGGAPLGSRYASLRSGAGQDAYTVLQRQFTLAAGEALQGLAEFLAGDALPYDDDGYVSVRPLGGAATQLFGASVATVGDYGTTGWMPFEFVAPAAGTYVLEAGVRNAQDNSVDSRLNLDAMDLFGAVQGVTLNADGTIGYDPGGRFEWLAEGETATEAFSLLVTDDLGAQGLAEAIVQVIGTNDAPEMGAGQTAASVNEDNALPPAAALGAQGAFAFGDVDLSDVHQVQLGTLDSGYLGAFAAQLAADSTGGGQGSVQWSFSIASGELDALSEGETRVQAYEVLVEDAFGGSDERLVTVTLVGVNDGAVAVDDAAAVQEDGVLLATGNVLANDSDADAGDVLSVVDHGTRVGAYGTLTLLADGSYRYELDNAAAQSLGAGEQIEERFAYAATDGRAFASAILSVRVSGANDAPAVGDDEALVQEDGILVASGNVLDNDSDPDNGTTLTVANAGLYGSLQLEPDGAYTYTLDNGSAVVQGLREGQVVLDAFEYLASDGLASTSGTLMVSVTGTNDAPVLALPIADQDAAAGTPFTFTLAPDTFTDIDIGDSLAYAASLADGSALPSWLSFDAATRTFAGTPPGGAGGGTGDDCGCGTDGGGAPATLELRVTATDTAGASASDAFVLNIAGGSSGDVIVPIAGTNGGDDLAGTSGNDIIDGRKGYDRMSGGAGDDAYYVDLTCMRDGHKGNEGVGNGEDPPPPGHDSNWNDGPGTSPGNPGAKGGWHGDGRGGHGGIECRVDLVVEGAVAGYDTVYSTASYALPANVEELHLLGSEDLEGRGNALANMLIGNSGDNRLYGLAGNDLLLDDAGRDRLDGGDGNDVLDGGRGSDLLLGGKGNDLFVHALGGGHDTVRDSGGQDAVRFGAGIAAADVTAFRHGDSLVLALADGAESVTIEDWFSSYASKRVEQVQFADGTVWGESEIRARAESAPAGYYGDSGPQGECNGWEDRQDGNQDDGGSGGGEYADGLYDAIAARLKTSPDYDFTALATYLQREGGGGYGAMTPEQIANRWVRVQTCVASLAPAPDDCGYGHGWHGGHGWGGGDWSRGWGHSGSTGQSSGSGGLQSFCGLGEGFYKL